MFIPKIIKKTFFSGIILMTVVAASLIAVEVNRDGIEPLITKVKKHIDSGQLQKSVATRLKKVFDLQSIYDSVLRAIPNDYWEPEDAGEREKLPFFETIPAAPTDELTPANGLPGREDYVNWHRSHGDSSASRYSVLQQINRSTVGDLKVAWIYRAGGKTGNVQSNPVIANGLMYLPVRGEQLVALDAKTGEEVWNVKSPGGIPAKRGLVYWKGDVGKGLAPRIYVPLTGLLAAAFDAKTGALIESFGNRGVLSKGTALAAPAIAKGVLVIATMAPSVEGYDVVTGKALWKLGLIEKLSKARVGGVPTVLSGGNPWGGMSLDEGRGIAYFTTGDPKPFIVGILRPGRNRHSNSVIAVDIMTGKKKWTFQEIRHDIWDLDIPAPPILTHIKRGGKKVDVVAAVTKLGNTLLLDRLSGKPIFDFRLRRAPTSSMPGEKTWAYQPDVQLPEPFSRQVFSLDDVTNLGAKNRQSVLDQLKNAQYGFFQPHEVGKETIYYGVHGGAEWTGASVDPETGMLYVSSNDLPWRISVMNRAAAYDESTLPVTAGRQLYVDHCSTCHGVNRAGRSGPSLIWVRMKLGSHEIKQIVKTGRNSMPPISALTDEQIDQVSSYFEKRDSVIREKRSQLTTANNFNFQYRDMVRLKDFEGYPGAKPPWGKLSAINLNTGKIVWQVPLGEYKKLTDRGVPVTGTENFGGPIVTLGGLVFVTGTKDKKVRAFDKATGEELWSHELPFVGTGPPATYELEGRQYLVVNATGSLKTKTEFGDAFVAFALP